MTKLTLQLIVALSLLALVLAACGPAAGGEVTPGVVGTESVPGTGTDVTPAAGLDATATTGAGTTGGDTGANSAECEGVDTTQLVSTGQTIYTEQCAGCHGEQGEGQENFPALTANANLSGADIPGLVQSYLAVEAHPKDLSVEDLAAVISYARATFNENAAVVCPAQIEGLLPAAQ